MFFTYQNMSSTATYYRLQNKPTSPAHNVDTKRQENSLADIRPQFVLLDYKALIYEK